MPTRPVYPAFFSDQASDLPQDLSEKTVAALKEASLLSRDSFLSLLPAVLRLHGRLGLCHRRRPSFAPPPHPPPSPPQTPPQIGVLDGEGNILDDPRKGFKNMTVDWRTQLRQRLPVYDDGIGPVTSLEKDASHVSGEQ